MGHPELRLQADRGWWLHGGGLPSRARRDPSVHGDVFFYDTLRLPGTIGNFHAVYWYVPSEVDNTALDDLSRWVLIVVLQELRFMCSSLL
jgi:hypothetical protein